MDDASPIMVSFDQMSAVRLRDKARLKAVRVGHTWGSSCTTCAAKSWPQMDGCDTLTAHAKRFCHPADRKDSKPIHWEEVKE